MIYPFGRGLPHDIFLHFAYDLPTCFVVFVSLLQSFPFLHFFFLLCLLS